MFKTILEFDEERMRKDGLDVEEAWNQIEEMLRQAEHSHMESRGHIFIDDYSSEMFLEYLIQSCAWATKYMKKWFVDYNRGDGYDNVMEDLKQIGVKLGYE